jgi:hypothetical protein
MNHFIAGILRIILLEAGVALLVIARVLPNSADAISVKKHRRLDFAFVAVAALALFAWTNFGQLRGDGNYVHRWEQYHFFFGSKYLREVGYFDLYKATVLADREGDRILVDAQTTRDLTTFNEVPLSEAMADGPRVRARFTDERWASFKQDWLLLSRGDRIWQQAITDHGNSASPAWAIFGTPISYLFGISPAGQKGMALIDFALMIALFGTLWKTFGTRAASVALVIFSMVPFSFDYLAGSLLRWDWLFALGLCLCFWQRKRPLVSGAFLGYAVASKLFPLFFGVAFVIQALWQFAKHKKLDLRVVRFAAGAALAIVISVVISSAMFGPTIWIGYAKRIEVAQREKFYSNQYSFKTVFLQLAASTGAELEDGLLIPNEIKQGRNDVELSQYQGAYLFFQLALTLLVAFALSKADELEALAIGPLLVFVWLTVNAYYWNMLALPALIWGLREQEKKRGSLIPLLFMHGALMAFYLMQHLNRGYAEGYAGGVMMLVLLILWSVTTLLRPKAESAAA